MSALRKDMRLMVLGYNYIGAKAKPTLLGMDT